MKYIIVNGARADYLFRLQELIAPRDVLFFNSDFQLIGDKEGLKDHVREVTSISTDVLSHHHSLSNISVAVRMRWASKRTSTRPEDLAYSLLGIFDINMALLYGEGDKAFQRLQVEIIRHSDDESIFAWQKKNSGRKSVTKGLLSHNPSWFSEVNDYRFGNCFDRQHYEVTNKGIRIVCNFPNGLVKKLSNQRRDLRILLMPLNVYRREVGCVTVPCLRFYVSTSHTPSTQVNHLTGARMGLEVVTDIDLTTTLAIKKAAERFKNDVDHFWDEFCGDDDDEDHTAIPVYFPLA